MPDSVPARRSSATGLHTSIGQAAQFDELEAIFTLKSDSLCLKIAINGNGTLTYRLNGQEASEAGNDEDDTIPLLRYTNLSYPERSGTLVYDSHVMTLGKPPSHNAIAMTFGTADEVANLGE